VWCVSTNGDGKAGVIAADVLAPNSDGKVLNPAACSEAGGIASADVFVHNFGDLPASLGEPDAAAKVPTEIGLLCACLSRVLRVNHMTYIQVANTFVFCMYRNKAGPLTIASWVGSD